MFFFLIVFGYFFFSSLLSVLDFLRHSTIHRTETFLQFMSNAAQVVKKQKKMFVKHRKRIRRNRKRISTIVVIYWLLCIDFDIGIFNFDKDTSNAIRRHQDQKNQPTNMYRVQLTTGYNMSSYNAIFNRTETKR